MSKEKPKGLEPIKIDRQPTVLEGNDRITQVVSLNYEQRGVEPFVIRSVADRLLSISDDGPYSRRVRVGQEWQPFDLGWFKPEDIGVLVLENLSGPDKSVRLLIEVGVPTDTLTWLVYPGWPFYGTPTRIDLMKMRCVGGEVRCKTTVFPK